MSTNQTIDMAVIQLGTDIYGKRVALSLQVPAPALSDLLWLYAHHTILNNYFKAACDEVGAVAGNCQYPVFLVNESAEQGCDLLEEGYAPGNSVKLMLAVQASWSLSRSVLIHAASDAGLDASALSSVCGQDNVCAATDAACASV